LHQAYGHALLESRSDAKLDLAIQQLLEANRLEDRVPGTWRFLAAAWGRKAEVTGDQRYAATATYALAEEAAAMGRDRAAAQYADRAMKGLPKGSAYWLRAQDIKLSAGGAEDEKGKGDRRPKDDR
jgi:predicted Zn-dependent protease